LPQAPDQVSAAQMLAAWLSLALLGWQLAVQGHILRHAMDLPFRLGMLLAVVFFALEFTLAVLLLGRPQ
jgi:predicted hotdog family 3-hydroxylacyl-ACP dehydratase